MSVRAWFTISAVVLVVLTAAFALRFFAPVPAPAIVARVGGIRLVGQATADCWPQRNARLRCHRRSSSWTRPARLRGKGTIHIVVAYPIQPRAGSLVILRRDGATVTTSGWRESLAYDLQPGEYALQAVAEYPKGARVAYYFPITVQSP